MLSDLPLDVLELIGAEACVSESPQGRTLPSFRSSRRLAAQKNHQAAIQLQRINRGFAVVGRKQAVKAVFFRTDEQSHAFDKHIEAHPGLLSAIQDLTTDDGVSHISVGVLANVVTLSMQMHYADVIKLSDSLDANGSGRLRELTLHISGIQTERDLERVMRLPEAVSRLIGRFSQTLEVLHVSDRDADTTEHEVHPDYLEHTKLAAPLSLPSLPRLRHVHLPRCVHMNPLLAAAARSTTSQACCVVTDSSSLEWLPEDVKAKISGLYVPDASDSAVDENIEAMAMQDEWRTASTILSPFDWRVPGLTFALCDFDSSDELDRCVPRARPSDDDSGEELGFLNKVLNKATFLPNLRHVDYETADAAIEIAEVELSSGESDQALGWSFKERARARGLQLELHLTG